MTCPKKCVCVHVCMCGDEVVLMITRWFCEQTSCSYLLTVLLNHDIDAVSTVVLYVCIGHCTHPWGAQLPSQPLGLEVMLRHAPVAGLLESGVRSTCVQQSSRCACPLCWTSVHCSLATIWLLYTLLYYKAIRSIGGDISKSEQYQTRAAHIL